MTGPGEEVTPENLDELWEQDPEQSGRIPGLIDESN